MGFLKKLINATFNQNDIKKKGRIIRYIDKLHVFGIIACFCPWYKIKNTHLGLLLIWTVWEICRAVIKTFQSFINFAISKHGFGKFQKGQENQYWRAYN